MSGSGNTTSGTKKVDPIKLLHLFQRPTEPVFMPKGDTNEVFDIPQNYLIDKYKPFGDGLASRFGASSPKIPVKTIRLPDISTIEAFGRRNNFSLHIPYHRRLASRLVDIFINMRDTDDLMSAAVYCRDRVNPYMFVYALSIAILHRPDTKNMDIPSLCEVFPEKFANAESFAQAREDSTIIEDGQGRTSNPIVIPKDYTASDLDIEHRLAYFREDLGINLHHWHWHLVYPFAEQRQIVDKDRRGELFYYMHHQIMARYNFERLCNGLARTKRLTNFRDPIPEGYFPKLDSIVSSRNWPSRNANSFLYDVDRENDRLKFDIQDLERWRDRIFAAIHVGAVVDSNGRTIPLDETRGIDILGNIIEASPVLSVNPNLYGDLHNLAHAAIACCHDPDYRHLESFAPIADPAVAMRDPAFYRLHAFVDDIFLEHKNTLPQYTYQQLDFPGVRVTGVKVISQDPLVSTFRGENRFFTYWKQDDVNFSNGLDFAPRGPILARFTHLQHTPFIYNIQVESPRAQVGTVRIFLAPQFDERGLPMTFRDHSLLFIEMDKFTTQLKPGTNLIQRRSDQSSVTIPFERTFRNLDVTVQNEAQRQAFEFCGCGWPQHMLLPRGAPAGFPAQLFVMVSDFNLDRVEGSNSTSSCDDAVSFCGLRDTKFPDRRSMGFPFDRQPRTGAETIQQFLTPNMALMDVSILHTDLTIPPRGANQTPAAA